jgi:hypothetical protein
VVAIAPLGESCLDAAYGGIALVSNSRNSTELVGLNLRVEYAKDIEVNRTYIMTVDLALDPGASWPEEEGEEYLFRCSTYCYGFDCKPMDEPIIVLRRTGDSYGPAKFAIRATARCQDAMFWVTIANRYWMPIKRAHLLITAS